MGCSLLFPCNDQHKVGSFCYANMSLDLYICHHQYSSHRMRRCEFVVLVTYTIASPRSTHIRQLSYPRPASLFRILDNYYYSTEPRHQPAPIPSQNSRHHPSYAHAPSYHNRLPLPRLTSTSLALASSSHPVHVHLLLAPLFPLSFPSHHRPRPLLLIPACLRRMLRWNTQSCNLLGMW